MTSPTDSGYYPQIVGAASALAYLLAGPEQGPQYAVSILAAGVAIHLFEKGQQGLQNAAQSVKREWDHISSGDKVIIGTATGVATFVGGIPMGAAVFGGLSIVRSFLL